MPFDNNGQNYFGGDLGAKWAVAAALSIRAAAILKSDSQILIIAFLLDMLFKNFGSDCDLHKMFLVIVI